MNGRVDKNDNSTCDEDDQLLSEAESSASPVATNGGALLAITEQSETPVETENGAILAETSSRQN